MFRVIVRFTNGTRSEWDIHPNDYPAAMFPDSSLKVDSIEISPITEHEPDTGPGPSNTVDCSSSE